MKTSVIFFLIVILITACHNESSKNKNILVDEKPSNVQVLSDTTASNKAINKTSHSTQEISLQKKQTDTVLFKAFNDEGDYFLFIVNQGKKEMALIYNDDIPNRNDFVRGDKIIIEWGLDSIRNAGDDEVLDFVKRLRKAKKIKDGKLSLFRKEYRKTIMYVSNNAVDNYSEHFINQVYNIVEYVVANSRAETLQQVLQTPKVTLFYSITEIEKANRMYYVFHISSKMDEQFENIQQIYQDVESATLYEYDPVTDALIAID
ncbi:hypothetical protein SAMN05660841_03077 [Sphingobacterium nematocida]|uniref:Uncharacterized protein n=1 Tax=Sphingobacterium nematocida TaxID=1513896 RepID=A0A1T5F6D0_9SPHI|nr:hypothetical protein [Sphingobacterium nematocida]SKB91746.1 hypothetical protein SAMN05660841_03077 [Sphingobacterium nematocida]